MRNGRIRFAQILREAGVADRVHIVFPEVRDRHRVTDTMASAAKAAAFAALLRVFVVAFDAYKYDWKPVVWALAVLSMVVGSALAIIQTDVKRMLAYSSISHAG